MSRLCRVVSRLCRGCVAVVSRSGRVVSGCVGLGSVGLSWVVVLCCVVLCCVVLCCVVLCCVVWCGVVWFVVVCRGLSQKCVPQKTATLLNSVHVENLEDQRVPLHHQELECQRSARQKQALLALPPTVPPAAGREQGFASECTRG